MVPDDIFNKVVFFSPLVNLSLTSSSNDILPEILTKPSFN